MGVFAPFRIDLLFPFPCWGIFNYNLFKFFLIPFLFLFFWDPYNLNVGAFDVVPEVSEVILSSFHSFYFMLLFRSYFHHFIFQLIDSFFCFRYSAIDSFQKVKVTQLCPTLCNPMDCPWNSPGQNTGVGSLSLLQGIFPTQGSNPGLPHCRRILYQLS